MLSNSKKRMLKKNNFNPKFISDGDYFTPIKLNEVVNMLDSFPKMRTIKEEHILSLLLYYELIKELKNVN